MAWPRPYRRPAAESKPKTGVPPPFTTHIFSGQNYENL